MESQNIFDDEVFFEGYRELREGANFNDLLEQPAMDALLDDVSGLRILDIGCGYGRNCASFAKNARSVVGIDISRKMLNVAEKENSASNIRYIQMDMADLSSLEGPFDLIYSSLAFHYALDFGRLMKDCHDLLVPGGTLLFSQEHPITTAAKYTQTRYVKDDEGRVSFKISDYQDEGERHVRWFVDDVIHQHRKLSTIISVMAKSGFEITDCVEPCPTKRAVKELPRLRNDLVKPSFLIMKARRKED